MYGTAFALAAGLAVANAAPQVPGYTGADAPYASNTPSPSMITRLATKFGPDSQVSAMSSAAPDVHNTLRSDNNTGPTSHGPFSGTATTTGAVTTATSALSIAPMPLNPTATYYNTNGKLQNVEPAPYTPAGGLGTNGSLPRYMVNSDFDYESITLGLYQEWIELDCFNNGLATFSEEDFAAAGVSPEQMEIIRYMAQQEQGHATLLTNMLGETAPPQCTYNYPYSTVREFLQFNEVITRWGESGVWGFINHLDSREVGQLLAQSIATEARQQLIFRQLSGLFPMPVWFETGIPQSWQWTYLAPYISSCPANTTRLAWQNFPALKIINQANKERTSPNDTAAWEVVGNRTSDPNTMPALNESCLYANESGYNCAPGISRNRSEPLTFPGKRLDLYWEAPGLAVGPNSSYTTSINPLAEGPKFVAFVSQLNLTYVPLTMTSNNTGYCFQPNSTVYENDPAVNGTSFIALTSTDTFLTPFNLSMINPYVAALGMFYSG